MNITPYAARNMKREPASPKQKHPCPGCLTNPRSASGILCGACWRKVPRGLVALFRRPGQKKTAISAILTHFRRERTEPRLGGF